MPNADFPRYLETWSEELISRANRVRLLIGDSHWLSDGHHKEYLICEFLKRHLPSNLTLGRGFIKPVYGEVCSPEIDILVSDTRLHTPFFNEGGLSIIAPSACISHFEVKTTFKKETLKNALTSQIKIRSIIQKNKGANFLKNVWSGIAFFSSASEKTSLEKTRKIVEKSIQECVHSSIETECLPRCISIFDSSSFFLRPSSVDKTCHIKGFTLGRLSAAIMFSDFFSDLQAKYSDDQSPSELENIIQSLSPSDIYSGSISVGDSND